MTDRPFWQQSSVTLQMVTEAHPTAVAITSPSGAPDALADVSVYYQGITEPRDIDVEPDDPLWIDAMQRVTTLYCDGGVFRPRRCEVGSWAWVGADNQGRRVAYQRGWLEAHGVVGDGVTNNISEFAAMMKAVEAIGKVSPGWSGRVASDSQITIGRFRDGWRQRGLPRGWTTRLTQALDRVGDLEYVHLKGHPNKAEISQGEGVRRRNGRRYPVSEHQVFCDSLCTSVLDTWSVFSGVKR